MKLECNLISWFLRALRWQERFENIYKIISCCKKCSTGYTDPASNVFHKISSTLKWCYLVIWVSSWKQVLNWTVVRVTILISSNCNREHLWLRLGVQPNCHEASWFHDQLCNFSWRCHHLSWVQVLQKIFVSIQTRTTNVVRNARSRYTLKLSLFFNQWMNEWINKLTEYI